MIETAEAAVDYMREHLGLKVGLLHVTCFRPFPSVEIVRALRHVKADCRDRAAGHSDDAVESAALRNQGGVRRRHGGHAGLPGDPPDAEVLRRLGRSGQPRRARRRLHRHGGEHAQRAVRATTSPSASSTRRRSPVTIDPDVRVAGLVLHARPFRRRLRFGHHQQGHRHDCRRSLRHGRAGVSEVRVGEEGPADHLLPDHRQASTSACTPNWSTSNSSR